MFVCRLFLKVFCLYVGFSALSWYAIMSDIFLDVNCICDVVYCYYGLLLFSCVGIFKF